MIKIKFTDEEILREVSLSTIGNHVVEIIGLSEPNLTGFETYRYSDEKKLGDFSDFTTLFRTVDGGFQFSNDGSIYPYIPDPTTPEKVEALQDNMNAANVSIEALTKETAKCSTNTTDNSNGIFELAMVTDENSEALLEMAMYVASLEERLVALEGGK